MHPDDAVEIIKKLGAGNKPRKIAAVLDTLPLPEHIDKHFKTPGHAYIWDSQPRRCSSPPELDNKHMGVWVNDTLDYVHVVFVSKEVLEYILSKTKQP